MNILIIDPGADNESGYYVRTVKTEFERRGYRVALCSWDSSVRGLLNLLKAARKSNMMIIPVNCFAGGSAWKNKLLLKTLKKRCPRIDILLSSDLQSCPVAGINWKWLTRGGFRMLAPDIESAAAAEKQGAVNVVITGMPVDMAAHDMESPDVRLTGGRLNVAVADEAYLPVSRRIADRYPDYIRIINATRDSRTRLMERMRDCHVLLERGGHESPSSVMLRIMAEGKAGIGPGNAGYWNWIGEDQSLFYPEVENPTAEDGIYGVPFFLKGDSPEEELEKILLLMTDRGILREIGEAGRGHVRRNHSSEHIADRIFSDCL